LEVDFTFLGNNEQIWLSSKKVQTRSENLEAVVKQLAIQHRTATWCVRTVILFDRLIVRDTLTNCAVRLSNSTSIYPLRARKLRRILRNPIRAKLSLKKGHYFKEMSLTNESGQEVQANELFVSSNEPDIEIQIPPKLSNVCKYQNRAYTAESSGGIALPVEL
jgi:hypothetical protein